MIGDKEWSVLLSPELFHLKKNLHLEFQNYTEYIYFFERK